VVVSRLPNPHCTQNWNYVGLDTTGVTVIIDLRAYMIFSPGIEKYFVT